MGVAVAVGGVCLEAYGGGFDESAHAVGGFLGVAASAWGSADSDETDVFGGAVEVDFDDVAVGDAGDVGEVVGSGGGGGDGVDFAGAEEGEA